jgi:hypothetical protein
MRRTILRTTAVLAAFLLSGAVGMAFQRGGGGGGGGGGRQAKSSVNRAGGGGASQSANRNTNQNVNRNTNVNQNTNVNRNTNVNVDRDVHVDVDNHGGYGGYGNGCCHHPVAGAMAVTAAVTATAAVVGAIFSPAQMPTSGCATQVVNGIAYQQCGSTWYQPQYAGSDVTYVVVSQP